MGKLTISMTIFKFANCLFTRPGIAMVLQVEGKKEYPQFQWIIIMFPS